MSLAIDFSNALSLQARADFAPYSDGFGLRVRLGSAGLFSEASVLGYYRFASDGRGSCGYTGGGGGILAISNIIFSESPGTGQTGPFSTPLFVAALLRYELALSSNVSMFVEIRPALVLGLGGRTATLVPLFGVGFNFYF